MHLCADGWRMGEGGRTRTVRRQEVSNTLVDRLEAIASPNRLRLLGLLQEPQTVSDIELVATAEENDRDRQITRQGVRHHLNKLRDAGFVEARSIGSQGKRAHEYVADPRRLYELGEILRAMPLALGSSPDDLGAPPTWDAPETAPNLTVVHGAEIGLSFPLRGEPNIAGRGWILGSGSEADVQLDWDSHADPQTGEIERRGGSFRLIDLRASTHRVSLNGRELDRGEVREVTDGDLVGVGLSLLRFQG